ncbi:MAG: (d)CMP kinase [Myxococcota bacterium]
MIITIDGPAGSGKSTSAKLLAQRLGFFHLDTGAIYRSVAYLLKKESISFDDEEKASEIASRMKIDFIRDKGHYKVVVNGEDVTDKIRLPEISIGASDVGKLKKVRMALIEVQRGFARVNNVVAEGRDMGTVIFPEAEAKFYLDASFDVRAERRQKELAERGIIKDLREIIEELKKRDDQDSKRDIAPLKPARDAIIVNTDKMGVDEVVEFLYSEVKKRWK